MAKWPDDVKEFVYQSYRGVGPTDMARIVSEKFDYPVTASRMKSFYHNHNMNSGITGHFQKGHIPANKGKKQTEFMSPEAIARTEGTRFKAGGQPPNTLPIGTVIEMKDGYLWFKVDDKPKAKKRVNWIPLHEFIYQFWNGPVPKGCLVFFKNKNKRDFSRENLGLITRKELVRMNQKDLITEYADITDSYLALTRLRNKIKEKETNVDGKQKRRNGSQL